MKNSFKLGALALVIAVAFSACNGSGKSGSTDTTVKKDSTVKVDSTVKKDTTATAVKTDTTKKDTSAKK